MIKAIAIHLVSFFWILLLVVDRDSNNFLGQAIGGAGGVQMFIYRFEMFAKKVEMKSNFLYSLILKHLVAYNAILFILYIWNSPAVI